MKLDTAEISSIIKEQIKGFEATAADANVGSIVSVADGVALIHGLAGAMAGEMLEFPDNTMGMVLNLEEDSVGAVIFGEYIHLREGDEVKSTGRIFEVPTGPELKGRVVDALGRPIDGLGPPLGTGIKSIDAMIPVGRGQRELIIGDRQTGKTAIAIDTIINQKDSGVTCIYVAVGQKASTVATVVRTLKEHGALENTIVALQYIAPYTGCTMGEYFRDRGEDALNRLGLIVKFL